MGQLLVALDVDSGARALAAREPSFATWPAASRSAAGCSRRKAPRSSGALVETGASVFLDLKFHDIPNTVAQAVEAAVSTGAWMINVHASGGVPMMQAAARAAADTAAREGRRRPLLIGVTVLTSMDDATLRAAGVQRPLLEQVVALARMAQEAGLDGVVASPQETAAIRSACGPDFAIVTPGIRGASAGADKNDQSRTMGPAEAVRAGASYIVVGRPIIAAADPRAAAAAIAEELGRRRRPLQGRPERLSPHDDRRAGRLSRPVSATSL